MKIKLKPDAKAHAKPELPKKTVDVIHDLEAKHLKKLFEKNIKLSQYMLKWDHQRKLTLRRKLTQQCHDGRKKQKLMVHGVDKFQVRQCFKHNYELTRLYQNMPLHLVNENIDQRTFVMRKERDRLQARLNELMKEKERKLIEYSEVEKHIIFRDEFVLDEEIKSLELIKKIENSKTRLQSHISINDTYKKVTQVLKQDASFYNLILASLTADIDNQSELIEHVIFLGKPAIARFKELSDEHGAAKVKSELWVKKTLLEEKKTLNLIKDMAKTIKEAPIEDLKAEKNLRRKPKPFLLVSGLMNMEKIMQDILYNTTASKVLEILPNVRLHERTMNKICKTVQHYEMSKMHDKSKMQQAELWHEVARHTSVKEQTTLEEKINNLKNAIKQEDDIEADTLAHIKNSAQMFVLLRFAFGKINDILRYVGKADKIVPVTYPTLCLELPLLKFETLTMRAYPPVTYDQHLKRILDVIQYKLKKVVKSYAHYARDLTTAQIKDLVAKYDIEYLETMQFLKFEKPISKQEEEQVMEVRYSIVPKRTSLKLESAEIVNKVKREALN